MAVLARFEGPALGGEVEDYAVILDALKWQQGPDLKNTGVDVSMNRRELADDFRCIQSGPITDIHFWGSFYQDQLPGGDPTNMTIKLTRSLARFLNYRNSTAASGYRFQFGLKGQLIWAGQKGE